MKTTITKCLIAAFGLALATAPLAASAETWGDRDHDHDRGRVVVERVQYRPEIIVERPRFVEGFYGFAPAGFYGYFHEGQWFHHRRWGNGFWIYF
jgi:hypothetical protein